MQAESTAQGHLDIGRQAAGCADAHRSIHKHHAGAAAPVDEAAGGREVELCCQTVPGSRSQRAAHMPHKGEHERVFCPLEERLQSSREHGSGAVGAPRVARHLVPDSCRRLPLSSQSTHAGRQKRQGGKQAAAAAAAGRQAGGGSSIDTAAAAAAAAHHGVGQAGGDVSMHRGGVVDAVVVGPEGVWNVKRRQDHFWNAQEICKQRWQQLATAGMGRAAARGASQGMAEPRGQAGALAGGQVGPAAGSPASRKEQGKELSTSIMSGCRSHSASSVAVSRSRWRQSSSKCARCCLMNCMHLQLQAGSQSERMRLQLSSAQLGWNAGVALRSKLHAAPPFETASCPPGLAAPGGQTASCPGAPGCRVRLGGQPSACGGPACRWPPVKRGRSQPRAGAPPSHGQSVHPRWPRPAWWAVSTGIGRAAGAAAVTAGRPTREGGGEKGWQGGADINLAVGGPAARRPRPLASPPTCKRWLKPPGSVCTSSLAPWHPAKLHNAARASKSCMKQRAGILD